MAKKRQTEITFYSPTSPQMQSNVRYKSQLFSLASAVALFGLTACGGGGGGETHTTTSPPVIVSPVTTVQSTGGDLSKYANTTWVSECGLPLVNGVPTLLSQLTTIRFAAPVGMTLTGSISTTQYSGISCSGDRVANTGSVVPVRFNYIRQLTVTSGTPVTAQGTADELLITEVNTNATQTLTIGFLPDFQKFLTSTSSRFTGLALRYNKL
jgi:hypothetical protein